MKLSINKKIAGVGLILVGLAIAGLAVGPRVWSRVQLQYGTPPVCASTAGEVASGGIWEQVAFITPPGGERWATVLDGRIYMPSALVAGYAPSTIFEMYDPIVNIWQQATPLPIALHHPSVAAANGRIYVTGGWDSVDLMPDVASAWAYDPAADTWTEIAPMPSPRAAHVMVNIDDKLYVATGVGPEPLALWLYDPETDTWDTLRSPLPAPARDHAAAAVVDGKLYIFGGRWNSQGNFGTVDRYDPITDTWERLPDMPTPRSGAAVAVLNNLIHVAGGENLSAGCVYKLHEVFNPETGAWSRQGDLPTSRHLPASVVVNNRWYVIGGASGSGPRTEYTLSTVVEVFTPEN